MIQIRIQEIQLSNGEIFKIVYSSIPMTQELIRSVTNTLETSKHVYMSPQTSVTGGDKPYVVSAACTSPIGTVTTTYPGPIVAGSPFTITITATNTSTTNENTRYSNEQQRYI